MIGQHNSYDRVVSAFFSRVKLKATNRFLLCFHLYECCKLSCRFSDCFFSHFGTFSSVSQTRNLYRVTRNLYRVVGDARSVRLSFGRQFRHPFPSSLDFRPPCLQSWLRKATFELRDVRQGGSKGRSEGKSLCPFENFFPPWTPSLRNLDGRPEG